MVAIQTAQPTARGHVTETVAVLGAGSAMGFPIARNIARAGLPVRVWDPLDDKAEPLVADGAYLARTPKEAASGAGIVLTMLVGAAAVIGAMTGSDGALAVMPDAHKGDGDPAVDPNGPYHALWLQMSPIGATATKRCAELANRAGVGFVDAPTIGSRHAAAERTLVVLESGPEEARPRIHPIFDAIARRTIRVGEAGLGSRLTENLEAAHQQD